MDRDFEEFKHLFPPETKIINFRGCADNYVANLRCKCKNKEDFSKNWLKQYEQISGVTLRLQVTRPRCGKTVVYKAAYRCEQNTYPSSHRLVKASYKHTDCQAVMRVTMKSSTENRRVRSNDVLRGDYPTIITVEHNHNHGIKPASALENKCISQEEKRNNDSPAIEMQPQNEVVIEDFVHYYEVEKTNDSPPIEMQVQNEVVRENCLHYYEVEKTNDSPPIEMQVENEVVRENCEEPVDRSMYPSLYILSNTDVLQEMELTAHHVEVTTEHSWSSLKDRWKLLFEKWQKENSSAQYDALVRSVAVLNNCKTETDAISALECLNTKQNGTTAPARRSMQSDSIAKFSLSDHNYNKEKHPQNKQLSYALQDCDVQEQ